ncbi:MAG: hypothetical protein LQ348_006121 [Seirophora lacunosa]|nr:MAG: hypothetical protein LQ348_006121 [Seirophora lacunosa]
MSDNLSTMKQAAVAGADDSAVDMADPVTERNGTADNRDQPEDGNDAGSLTADDSESGKLVNGAKANASAAKQAKGTKASKASSTKVSPTKSSPTKTSPKKRANGVNDDEDGSPKKKRAPAKAKAAATAEQSTEEVAPKRKAAVKEEALTPEPADSAGVSDEVQVPVTPMKGKRKSAADQTTEFKTPRTPKTPKASTAAKEEKDTTPTPTTTPRKRLAADKVADKVSLPTSWGAASDADKELVAMKKSGSSWNDIRAMWMEKTGQNTATSTLPNR